MATTLNDNVAVHADKPIDARSMDFAGGISVPFANIAAANAAVNQAFRYQYLTVWILAANGDPIEHWWRADTNDSSLEPKDTESYTFNTDASISLKAGYNYQEFVVLPTTNIANLQIGTTLGGNDLEAGSAVLAGTSYKLGNLSYPTSTTSIFFTGLSTGTKIRVYKKF